jgi:dihydrofolate reductase
MGRKTFESLPGILPKRKHIVISQNLEFRIQNPEVLVVYSIEEALEKAQEFSEEIFIIGGGNIYSQTLHLANKLEITAVDFTCEADTFFPEIPKDTFQLTYREFHPKDEKNKYNFEFLTYKTTK